MKPARHAKSLPLFPNHYFNIYGLLLCCKTMKKLFFCGGPILQMLTYVADKRLQWARGLPVFIAVWRLHASGK